MVTLTITEQAGGTTEVYTGENILAVAASLFSALAATYGEFVDYQPMFEAIGEVSSLITDGEESGKVNGGEYNEAFTIDFVVE